MLTPEQNRFLDGLVALCDASTALSLSIGNLATSNLEVALLTLPIPKIEELNGVSSQFAKVRLHLFGEVQRVWRDLVSRPRADTDPLIASLRALAVDTCVLFMPVRGEDTLKNQFCDVSEHLRGMREFSDKPDSRFRDSLENLKEIW